MAPTKKIRKYTVLNRQRWPHYVPVPDLRLSGYWLEQAGFAPGARVRVQVQRGRLVITVIAPPGPWKRRLSPTGNY